MKYLLLVVLLLFVFVISIKNQVQAINRSIQNRENNRIVIKPTRIPRQQRKSPKISNLPTPSISQSYYFLNEVLIPYRSTGYKYKVVEFNEDQGFEMTDYDDSDFLTGDSAFGTEGPYCPGYNTNNIHTYWPVNTDILLRKYFFLPEGSRNVKVGVAIDNSVQVFINGYDISNGLQFNAIGCYSNDQFIFDVPNDILLIGNNLLAVRGRDLGVINFLDIKVIGDILKIMSF